MRIPFRKDPYAIAKAERIARFQNAIELAHEIAKIDAGGLVAYVRLIATPLQSRATLSAAFSALHGAQSATTSIDSLFFDSKHVLNQNGERAYELAPQRADRSYRFRLGIDPVIATPWRREGLANALATVGYAKRQGEWKERLNHKITLLLPIGIGLVSGGNHSLTAGIANGEGLVTSTGIHDVTALYPHVHYDGHAFVRTHDGQELSYPKDEEPGMLFEIGRLMVKHDVQCGVEYIDPNARPDPSASVDNGYYQVHINGQDAGVALTSSGASLALRQAGLTDGSAAWRNVITSADSFTRRTRDGKEERVQLTYRVRRRVVDDLSFVYGTMPWIPPDTD